MFLRRVDRKNRGMPPMSEPKLMTVNELPVDAIDDSNRLRPVSEAGVESLIASIGELGVMKDPIHVRKTKSGTFVLIAGGHRLEAARRLGWSVIEAKVWAEVTDDWARLMEIDDNLAGAEMNALDTAIFLAERKRVYEKLHPETKYTTGAELARKRWGNASDMVSFASATADKFGVSKRHIERLVAAGDKLATDEIDLLRGSDRPVTLKDLTEISKIGEDADRKAVVMRLSSGKVKTAAEARRALASSDTSALPKDPVEEAFKDLFARWKRAPVAARRRLVSEIYDDLSEYISDEQNRRDA
jgi:ParB family chromosome partitioning protein